MSLAAFLALTTFVLTTVLAVAVVVTTPPGAAVRYVRGVRYHRTGLARHALPTAPKTIPTVTVRTAS